MPRYYKYASFVVMAVSKYKVKLKHLRLAILG